MADFNVRRGDKRDLHRGNLLGDFIMRIAEFAQLVAQKKINGSSVVTLSIAEAVSLLNDMMFAFGRLETPHGQSFIEDIKKAGCT
jgi:hypothetical protein